MGLNWSVPATHVLCRGSGQTWGICNCNSNAPVIYYICSCNGKECVMGSFSALCNCNIMYYI